MIIQAILDFFRDLVVTWLGGLNSLMSGIDVGAAGAAIGGVAASAGHFLGLFISPSVWGAVLIAWGAWMALWSATALIAIISRRGASGGGKR